MDIIFMVLYNHQVDSSYYDSAIGVLEWFMVFHLEDGIDVYCGIGGDFHSRIGNQFLHNLNEDQNQLDETDNIFQRHSENTVTNCFGKVLIQSYYMFQVALLSGLLFGGVDGKVTFFLEMKQFSGKINFATFDHIYMLVSVIQKYF